MGHLSRASRLANRAPSAAAHTRGGPARESWGQALVEFAMVLPLLMLLIFGIIEFALINASIGAFNFATQDAARFAAIAGPTDPTADATMLAQEILPHVNGIVAAQLQTVEVFKANEDGSCFGGTFSFPCPAQDDHFFTAQTSQWTGQWTPDKRNDQLVTGDYLGVRISYVYTYITAFFATASPAVPLSAESIQRVEPQEYTKHQAPGLIASGPEPAQMSLMRALPMLASRFASRFAPMLAPLAHASTVRAFAPRNLIWGRPNLNAGSTYVEDRST
jgi:Flp pilus assembly protein TadG